jgi:hypothetical protein
MDARTQRLVELFDDINNTNKIDEIVNELYCNDASFHTPLHLIRSRSSIQQLLNQMSKALEYLETEIHKDVKNEDTLAIHWTMSFKLKRWPFPMSLNGVTWLDLNEDGRCIGQIDYWDSKELLKQMLPLKKWLPLKKLILKPA